MSAAQYDRLATQTMDTLYDSLEALVEEWSPEGTHGWDLEYSVRVPAPASPFLLLSL